MSTDLQQAKPAQSMEVMQITALQADLAAVKQVLAENLGAGGMSEFDLQRIKIPAGGGIAFEVTDLDGEKSVPKIKAVILLHRDVRGYWPSRESDDLEISTAVGVARWPHDLSAQLAPVALPVLGELLSRPG